MQVRPMAAQLNGAPFTNGETDSSAAMHATNGHAPPKVSDLDGKAPAPSDWANYFCTYAFLYHQVRLLTLSAAVTKIAVLETCLHQSACSGAAPAESAPAALLCRANPCCYAWERTPAAACAAAGP